VSLTRLWGREPELFRTPLEKPLTQETVRMSQEINRPKTRRQALLALGAGAAAVAVTALAPGSARAADLVAPDDTKITAMLLPANRKMLTAAAAKLTKGQLRALHEATVEGKLDAEEKKLGLKTEDINSISKAFLGHSDPATAKEKANGNISICCCCSPCCCCAAAVTLPVRGSRTVA
jgi:hypothetical protein